VVAVAAVAAVAQAAVAVVLGAKRVREEEVVVVAEWETEAGLHRVCREGLRQVK
jgi:hypothetical protein